MAATVRKPPFIYTVIIYTIIDVYFMPIFCSFSGLIYPPFRVNMYIPKGKTKTHRRIQKW